MPTNRIPFSLRALPKDFWISIAVAIVLSFLLGELALREAARDNPNPDVLPGLLFPYGVLVIYLGGNVWLALLLTIFQYAGYITLLEFAVNRMRMLIRLSVLHAIFATSCYLLASKNLWT